tara:strand:+ start:39 stop:731 length:693 start_codon:yes stop_codon:yes gene_type:complete
MNERILSLQRKVSARANSSRTVTREFIGMSGKSSDGDEPPRLDAANLPEEIQRLWDTMLRLDPDWSMNDWLIERATEEMRLIEANLGREKMRLEQRISRLEALSNRIGNDIELDRKGTRQSNLFDMFETGGVPTEIQDDYDSWEPHPAYAHLTYLQDDSGDDPLLAICAQAVLLHLENELATGDAFVSLENLGIALTPRGIDSEDLVEAIEWLLEQGIIIEVEENEFALG